MIPVVSLGVVALVAMALFFVFGGPGTGSSGAPVKVAAEENPLPDRSIATSGGATATADSVIEIEVPDVVGKDMETAEMIMEAAGLHVVTRVADAPAPGVKAEYIVAQDPQPGSRLDPKQPVTLVYQPKQSVSGAGDGALVVVIDPGHQAKADLRPEPIGPGSSVTKERVRGGCTGVATGIPEYREALSISLKLRALLQRQGIGVVMTRTTNDVDVSNKKRAEIGNKVKADLAVRVHCDGVNDHSVHGISTLFPSGNPWCNPIMPPSRKAAGIVHAAVVAATGAKSRGLFGHSDMTGFNWSTRPTIIVECGFLSNPDEDRRIATSSYQDKLASGLAKGVLTYLGR